MKINNRWFQLCRGRHRDGDDCEPAVFVDAVRQAAPAGHRLEGLRYPMGVHALHPVPDVGAARAGMADRSHGAAASSRRSPACSAAIGWARPRVSSPRSRCSTRCYVLAGIGAALIYGGCMGSALKWFTDRRGLAAGIIAGAFGGGTALFVPFIGWAIRTQGYQQAFLWTGLLPGRHDRDRRAIHATSGARRHRRWLPRVPPRAPTSARGNSRPARCCARRSSMCCTPCS